MRVLRVPAALALLCAGGTGHALTPRDVGQRVGFDQHLGRQLPLAVTLRDEQGAPVQLARLFGARPAVLVFIYYQCGQLCPLTMQSLVDSLRAAPAQAGRDFDVIVVSFDPRDDARAAAAQRTRYLARYGRGGDAGWHFLTGAAAQSATLARATGFRYAWDAQDNMFVHPSGILIATPEGRISRYFMGLDFPARQLDQAVRAAAAQRIGSLTGTVWLLCCRYDELVGRYGTLVAWLVRLGAMAVLVALALLVLRLLRTTR
ncbi:MAG TPA: SCO family protein [Steroidobacteraceae bacterium]|nr:SCO family protein [Steroidobacteraceae bacterium]